MKKKTLIGCVSIGAATIVCGAVALGSLAISGMLKPDTYTVYADDGYYSETTYYLTEKAFNDNFAVKEEKNDKSSKYTTASASLTNNAQPEEDFVMGVSKKVWVSETVGENGIVESKLLQKYEVDEFREDENIGDNNFILTSASVPAGNDLESKECLEIALVVTLRDDGTYTAHATACWEREAIGQGEKTAEQHAQDYIAVTWGGEETLVSVANSFYGYTFDNEEILGSRMISNSYGGYVWQFTEKLGFASKHIMEIAEATVSIKKDSSQLLGKSTSFRYAYIHTYNKTNTSVSLSYDDGFVPNISTTTVENNWQIQIDVPNIKY